MRPRQWSKNFLIVVAPLTSGAVFNMEVWPTLVLAFLIFTLISSSIYLINDIFDRELDRLHPKKRHRAIASGKLPVNISLSASFVLIVIALSAAATQSSKSFLIVSGYLVISLFYSIHLKHIPILEITIVALGFVMRVWFGASIVKAPVSIWLGISIFLGSTMIIIAKRQTELSHHDRNFVRPVILKYSDMALKATGISVAVLLILTFSLWTVFGQEDLIEDRIFLYISCIPFSIAVGRFVYIAQSSGVEEPEEFLLSDHITQIVGVIFTILLTTGIFVNS